VAEILLEAQGAASAPGAGNLILYPETVGKKLQYKDDAGRTYTVPGGIRNWSVTNQTGFASDTYMVGSAITVPATNTLQVGSVYCCRISLSKTNNGVAAPVYNIRVGTLGTTGDTAVCTFTGAAQTAVIDVGYVTIEAVWRTVGASGVLAGTFSMVHNTGAATGLIGSISPVIEVTSSAFNTTTASLIMGVSVNGGASAAYTVTRVVSELLNI
jgi:hypothetical protein